MTPFEMLFLNFGLWCPPLGSSILVSIGLPLETQKLFMTVTRPRHILFFGSALTSKLFTECTLGELMIGYLWL